MIRELILLVICVLLMVPIGAQVLERKGSLGAVIEANADSTAVLIKRVLPGSTAQKLGLQENDWVVSADGVKLKLPSDLISVTEHWREGDTIQLDYQRHDTYYVAKEAVVAKPREISEFGEVIYGHVDFNENQLRSILITPHGVDHPPVLFYLQGYGCASQDYYHSPHPVKVFVEDMVRRGVAVYRMEKPGVGDSRGDLRCDEIGYHLEVDAFTAGLRTLKRVDGIDSTRVFLFGHSLGGITAPQIAARIPVSGMVNYGSVSTSWYEYLMKMMREQSLIFDMDYQAIEERVRTRGPIVYDYLVKRHSLESLQSNPAYAGHLYDGLPHISESGTVMTRHFDFMPEINSVDITAALKDAATHTLALQGEFDIASIDEEWAKYEADVVNAYHPGKGEWRIVEKAEHGLATIESREQQMALRASGEFTLDYMATHYQAAIGEIVFDWILRVIDN